MVENAQQAIVGLIPDSPENFGQIGYPYLVIAFGLLMLIFIKILYFDIDNNVGIQEQWIQS